MATKVKTILLSLILILILGSSCSRSIRGATPHRRDRNCGCENLSTPGNQPESTCILPEQTGDCQL